VDCEGELVAVTTERAFAIGDTQVRVRNVPALRCKKCKSVFFDGPALERVETYLASRLLEAGVDGGAAFKFMRKAVGLRAIDVAELLGCRAETISRWENGAVEVDTGALATMSQIVVDKLHGTTQTIDQLRALAKRRQQHKGAARSLTIDFV
jgi:YgiT-type zinc finger domain-containing protein